MIKKFKNPLEGRRRPGWPRQPGRARRRKVRPRPFEGRRRLGLPRRPGRAWRRKMRQRPLDGRRRPGWPTWPGRAWRRKAHWRGGRGGAAGPDPRPQVEPLVRGGPLTLLPNQSFSFTKKAARTEPIPLFSHHNCHC